MSQGIYNGWCKGINLRMTVYFIFVDWDFVSFVKESYPNVQPLSSYIYVCVIPELCLHQDLHLLHSSCRFYTSESFWEAKHSIFFVVSLQNWQTSHICSHASLGRYQILLLVILVFVTIIHETHHTESITWHPQARSANVLNDTRYWVFRNLRRRPLNLCLLARTVILRFSRGLGCKIPGEKQEFADSVSVFSNFFLYNNVF